MNGESGNAQRELAVLTRTARLKRIHFTDIVSLKAGLVCLSLYLVGYVLFVFYPPVLELIEQVVFLAIAPVCLFVFFLIGRAALLLFRQLRK